MTPTIQEQAQEAREINKSNGWGEDYAPETIPGYLGLLHSEVSEAFRAGSNAEFLTELGDVIVRALDLGELMAPGQVPALCRFGPTLDDLPASVPRQVHPGHLPRTTALLHLHALVTDVLQDHRKVKPWGRAEAQMLAGLADVVWYTVVLMRATDRGCSPSAIVSAILAKNRTRGYRHGDLRT